MDKKTFIFLGVQGSGKGTQIGLVNEYLKKNNGGRDIVHFEMGRNLRALKERGDYTGKLSHEILRGGGLIPYAVSCAVFTDYLIDNINTGEEHLVIDGFPRTPEQVPALDSAMDFFKREEIVVVSLNISDDEAIKRLTPRKRYDDTEEGIRKRLQWSRELTMPNIKWFKEHGPRYRVVEVQGERLVEEVHNEIMTHLDLI